MMSRTYKKNWTIVSWNVNSIRARIVDSETDKSKNKNRIINNIQHLINLFKKLILISYVSKVNVLKIQKPLILQDTMHIGIVVQ